MKFELENSKILLLGQVGSKAYGTSTPESDDDYMGVCLAPMNNYIGLKEWNHHGTKEIKRRIKSVNFFANLSRFNFNANTCDLSTTVSERFAGFESS